MEMEILAGGTDLAGKDGEVLHVRVVCNRPPSEAWTRLLLYGRDRL